MKLNYFVRYWMPVLAWMFIIGAASTDLMSAEHTSRFIAPFLRWLAPDISLATIAAVQLFVRKAAHVTEYAILGLLLVRAFHQGSARSRAWSAALAWSIAVAWAALDEFHQSYVASRTGSPIDVMIDATGALVGLAIFWCFIRRKPKAVPESVA